MNCCGSVTTSGTVSRKSVIKSQTFVESGRSPVMMLAREGLQTACWQ